MCLLPLLEREWKATILREQLTLYLLAQEVEQNLLGPLWCRFSVRRPHCSQCPTDESSKNTSLRASSLLEGLSAEDKWIKNYSTWNFSWDATEWCLSCPQSCDLLDAKNYGIQLEKLQRLKKRELIFRWWTHGGNDLNHQDPEHEHYFYF